MRNPAFFVAPCLALGLLACQSTKPMPEEHPLEAPPQPPAADPSAITQDLCGASLGCELVGVKAMGPGKAGGDISIFEVKTSKAPESEEAPRTCTPHRRLFYRVQQGTEVETESQLLLDLCNDGYGASMVGEDIISYEPGYVTHEQSGGSSWRWYRSRTLQLDPIALAREENGSWRTISSYHEAGSMDWRTLEGEYQSHKIPCGPGGEPNVDDNTEIMPDFNGGYRLVPLLETPNIDWSTTALGACAARIQSDDDRGYVIHGEPGKAEDASMKVLLSESESTLVVEILDDTFVGEAKSWLFEDHLEIWRGSEGEQGMGCYNEGQGFLEQWGIPVDTGEVFAAYGKPSEMPTVKRYEFKSGDSSGVRLVIDFPPVPGERPLGMTVVYSDSDDGTTQERLIATSQFEFGKPHTLGASNIIDPARAICVQKDGALAVELVPFTGEWDKPVLSSLPD